MSQGNALVGSGVDSRPRVLALKLSIVEFHPLQIEPSPGQQGERPECALNKELEQRLAEQQILLHLGLDAINVKKEFREMVVALQADEATVDTELDNQLGLDKPMKADIRAFSRDWDDASGEIVALKNTLRQMQLRERS